MKKIMLVAAAAVLAFSLVGCKGGSKKVTLTFQFSQFSRESSLLLTTKPTNGLKRSLV